MKMMSVALTEDQVRARSKFQTRRLGWWLDKNDRRLCHVGDLLLLVRKSMGRKNTKTGEVEPIVPIVVVEVIRVDRGPLSDMTVDDVVAEGFPDWDVDRFVEFFTSSMRCDLFDDVTTIEWQYREDIDPESGLPWQIDAGLVEHEQQTLDVGEPLPCDVARCPRPADVRVTFEHLKNPVGYCTDHAYTRHGKPRWLYRQIAHLDPITKEYT